MRSTQSIFLLKSTPLIDIVMLG